MNIETLTLLEDALALLDEHADTIVDKTGDHPDRINGVIDRLDERIAKEVRKRGLTY